MGTYASRLLSLLSRLAHNHVMHMHTSTSLLWRNAVKNLDNDLLGDLKARARSVYAQCIHAILSGKGPSKIVLSPGALSSSMLILRSCTPKKQSYILCSSHLHYTAGPRLGQQPQNSVQTVFPGAQTQPVLKRIGDGPGLVVQAYADCRFVRGCWCVSLSVLKGDSDGSFHAQRKALVFFLLHMCKVLLLGSYAIQC